MCTRRHFNCNLQKYIVERSRLSRHPSCFSRLPRLVQLFLFLQLPAGKEERQVDAMQQAQEIEILVSASARLEIFETTNRTHRSRLLVCAPRARLVLYADGKAVKDFCPLLAHGRSSFLPSSTCTGTPLNLMQTIRNPRICTNDNTHGDHRNNASSSYFCKCLWILRCCGSLMI